MCSNSEVFNFSRLSISIQLYGVSLENVNKHGRLVAHRSGNRGGSSLLPFTLACSLSPFLPGPLLMQGATMSCSLRPFIRGPPLMQGETMSCSLLPFFPGRSLLSFRPGRSFLSFLPSWNLLQCKISVKH